MLLSFGFVAINSCTGTDLDPLGALRESLCCNVCAGLLDVGEANEERGREGVEGSTSKRSALSRWTLRGGSRREASVPRADRGSGT